MRYKTTGKTICAVPEFKSDKLAKKILTLRHLNDFSRITALENNKHITRALIGRKQRFYLTAYFKLICLFKLIRFD